MLYLVSLGLNEKGISLEGLEAVKKCKKIYLENYTADFPYKIEKLEKVIGKKIIALERNDVESQKLIDESKNQDVCLLIYGCALFATTHIGLLLDCAKAQIKTKIIYSASVFDAIAEIGLQLYKFGKVSSLTKWGKNFEPDSFLDFVIENKKINAHSLILIDIGLEINDALYELEESCKKRDVKIDKIIVCGRLGTPKSKIYYGEIEKLKNQKVDSPYCFVIPGEMHFLEKESLEGFRV